MMTSKLVREEKDFSSQVRPRVHSLLKQHAAEEGINLKFFVEAGMIMVLNKSGHQVMQVIEDFKEAKIK